MYREKVVSRFHPVMHFYFLEAFPTAAEIMEARKKFAVSLAAWSVTCHLLGIGDRHTNNILLDLSSGELVHIDYGIAFDKGRLLPVPEIVPFRLTPDLQAALGCFGGEEFDFSGYGWFRSTGEKVLARFREELPLVTAVLEVFLNDPLHQWANATNLGVIDRELKKRTGTSRLPFGAAVASDQNATARWTILQIKSKLKGTVVDVDEPEEPGAPAVPVSTVFQRLVCMASSDKRLSQMFVGWSPWV